MPPRTAAGPGPPGLPGARPGIPAIGRTGSDLLLWLYGQTELGLGPVPADLIARFRVLCFAD